MFQRNAKVKKEPANLNSMALVTFLKEASTQLKANEEFECAHYFSQVEEWLRSGKSVSSVPREVQKILGL
jgi:hypothetical protein|tara:strand:+ start:1058 stop:1267 length:210 start_codon:yes stop_codon:yes gene_type:complete